MAKKKEVKSEPIVSSIPVPPSDSALVIDLPDGQKLLVGKIETGTVIEVATWRGTGRPDSRTNRLMLGMSNEADSKPVQNPPNEQQELRDIPKQNPKYLFSVALKFIKLVLKRLSNIYKFLSSKLIIIRNKIRPAIAKYSKHKIGKKMTEIQGDTATSLEISDDFSLDFQRILDEVSNRRATYTDSPAKKGKKTTSSKRSKAKSDEKSEEKSIKKRK